MALKKTFKPLLKLTRNLKVCELRYKKDMTLNQLADYFGLSKQRVQQILERDLDKYIKLNKRNG